MEWQLAMAIRVIERLAAGETPIRPPSGDAGWEAHRAAMIAAAEEAIATEKTPSIQAGFIARRFAILTAETQAELWEAAGSRRPPDWQPNSAPPSPTP